MHETPTAPAASLAALADARTVVLTTFRRDGTGVPTAMSMAVDGDRAYMRTWRTSGKAKRLRRSPDATVAPSTTRGTPTGPALAVRARFIDGPDAERAGRLIAAKHPVLHGMAVPIAHRLTRRTPVYLELVMARGEG
jgi:PPOX class probable F420-dependent enzyme